MTVCTRGGGLAKDLISLMSFFESALRAAPWFGVEG